MYSLAPRLTRRACAGVERDAHSEVGLTLDTLRRLQLLSGTHVLVTSCGSGTSRLARVVALEPGGAWQEGASGLAQPPARHAAEPPLSGSDRRRVPGTGPGV